MAGPKSGPFQKMIAKLGIWQLNMFIYFQHNFRYIYIIEWCCQFAGLNLFYVIFQSTKLPNTNGGKYIYIYINLDNMYIHHVWSLSLSLSNAIGNDRSILFETKCTICQPQLKDYIGKISVFVWWVCWNGQSLDSCTKSWNLRCLQPLTFSST